jgi:hypothetical protein
VRRDPAVFGCGDNLAVILTTVKKIVCFLILVASPLCAQWYENGEKIPDTSWRKSKGEFGVMVLLSNDPERFMEEWNKPDQPTMRTTDVAERGKPIVAFVFFVGCREKKGICDSEVDFKVLKPDGKEYAAQIGGELWKNKPAGPKGTMQLSVANLGIWIEPQDPAGKYVVRAIARDLNAKRHIIVEQTFTVER